METGETQRVGGFLLLLELQTQVPGGQGPIPAPPFSWSPVTTHKLSQSNTRLFLRFDQHLSDPSVSKQKSVNASRSSSVTKILNQLLFREQHTVVCTAYLIRRSDGNFSKTELCKILPLPSLKSI